MPPGCKSVSKMIFFFKVANFLLKTLVQIQRYSTNTNLMSKHEKLLFILRDLIFREELLSYSSLVKRSRTTVLVVCYLKLSSL